MPMGARTAFRISARRVSKRREPLSRRAGEGLRIGPVLAQRRELGRNDQHVLLLDELAAGVGRPRAGGARLVTDAEPLGSVLVGPDMDPLVEPADLGMAAERERRQFRAALDPLGPAFDDGRGGA